MLARDLWDFFHDGLENKDIHAMLEYESVYITTNYFKSHMAKKMQKLFLIIADL